MGNKNEYVFAVKRGKRYVSGVACDDRKFAAQAPCFSYGVSGAVAGFQ